MRLHDYQKKAVEFILEKHSCCLFLGLGLGKTVITLTALDCLLTGGSAKKVLIIAPLRVAETVWRQEAQKWEHLRHLDFSICTGTCASRITAVESDSAITVVNVENLVWFVKKYGLGNYDVIVIDESSKFKSAKSARFKALKRNLNVGIKMILLTGTPIGNRISDLWSQIWLCDGGKRLGTTYSSFSNTYFTRPKSGSWYFTIPKRDALLQIEEKVKDICLSIQPSDLKGTDLSTQPSDFKDLPYADEINLEFDLPPLARQLYDGVKTDFIASVDSHFIKVGGQLSLLNKLLQITNGGYYKDDGEWITVHRSKVEGLKKIVEDYPDENFLIAYKYRAELDLIRGEFPDAKFFNKDKATIAAWNRGEIKMLLAHPQSAAHGLNLQDGGCVVVWFGLPLEFELYEQFNGRLARQGQTQDVIVICILAKDTIDMSVCAYLQSHKCRLDGFLESFKRGAV